MQGGVRPLLKIQVPAFQPVRTQATLQLRKTPQSCTQRREAQHAGLPTRTKALAARPVGLTVGVG